MKRIFVNILIILSLSLTILSQEREVFKPNPLPSTLLKPTLKVSCTKDLNYWKQPNLKNFWSWMPRLQFSVSGPIDNASYFSYEFFTADGKPWFSVDSEPFSIREGDFLNFESEAVPKWTDKRSTIATGTFSFKITLKNPLQNTSKLFYQGKFNVKKEFAGTSHPDFKNQYLFYVDQDWRLPIAYLSFNAKQDADSPYFQATMWFRGDFRSKIKGYLFYNGKQVANTDQTGGVNQVDYVFVDGDSDTKFRWEASTLNFFNARLFDNKGENASRHIFKNKPGNYEIKVLLDDEIVRTAAFTVGADGKLVDNGIAKNSGITGFGIIVPAKVIPLKEGMVDLQSYKTDSFYGNPLIGFSVQ